MIYSTATVPVNPDGETPLTRTQVWTGLERKARDARLFLPAGLCTRCDVTEESATHLVRDATIAGEPVGDEDLGGGAFDHGATRRAISSASRDACVTITPCATPS